MKIKILIIFFINAFFTSLNAQIAINKIAAYDNESSFTSGIFAISSSQIFRYSWYYQQWLTMPRNGLVQNNGEYVINNIAVYNNKWDNSSGIFVHSDTAIFNYNWISQYWYKLSNNGLPRNAQNKIDVREMTVYGDSGSSANSQLFVLTNIGIYRYSWYHQQWFALSNSGLPLTNKTVPVSNFDIDVVPNPAVDNAVIRMQLPVNAVNNYMDLAFVNQRGQVIYSDKVKVNNEYFEYVIPLQKLVPGVYFCEIRILDLFSTVKLIKINPN